MIDNLFFSCYTEGMSNLFDVNRLQNLLKDFYTAVGIRISVFDEQFSLVTEYPINAPKYCSYIRTTERGTNGCRTCDLAACERAAKMQEAHIYVCHAGITEAITPIRFENDVLGYVILAHMMPLEGYEKAFENAVKRCESYGLNKALAQEYLSEITPRNQEQILACTHLLDAVSSYLYAANLVKRNNGELANRISQFIVENLSEKLTSDWICRKFFISRTKLYMVSNKIFGMGISQYILSLRIATAKKLLKESNLPLAKIAESVGFPDESYFGKVFKKETGFTPSAYRKA